MLNFENLLIDRLVSGGDTSYPVARIQANIEGINALNPKVDLWSLVGMIYSILLLPLNIFLSIYIGKRIESRIS